MVLAIGEEEEAELAGLNVLQARSPEAARRASEGLRRDPRVEYAHVIQERYLFAPARRAGARRPRADEALDPMKNRQWGLGAIKLYQAQQSPGFREAKDVVIAVIDTGVDSGHPDLAGILVDERNFTSGPLRDTKGHGTHVIGIIAAVRNNRIGISGVCQSRKIMSLKALGPYNGPGYYRAIRYATDNGGQVINLSLGGSYDPTEELLVRRALRRGAVVVAAMGNEFEEGNPTSYPAAIDGVIAVGASTEVDRRASFSNTGRHIDLVAPGVNILSTVPTYPSELAETEFYDSWPGTSMATPFVAATAALLLSRRPRATVARVRRALTRGAERVPGQTGFNSEFGHGRLSVAGTLARI
jgi:subtilisin family serine protease